MVQKKLVDPPRKHSEPDGRKGQLTRERLLAATATLLTERGYSGTRLSDIGRLAEVQAPAIYYYYESREALIEEVVRRGQQTAQEHVENALNQLAAGTPYMQQIRCAVEEHLRVVLSLSDFTTAAIRNMGQLPEPMRKQIQSDHRKYGLLWKSLFEKAQENGELRPGINATAARLLILGALNWSPEWWKSRVVDIEEVVAAALALTSGLEAETSSEARPE